MLAYRQASEMAANRLRHQSLAETTRIKNGWPAKPTLETGHFVFMERGLLWGRREEQTGIRERRCV